MIAALIALKDFVFGAATYVLQRWRVFLPLAIVGYMARHIYSLTGERDDARKALASLSGYIAEENAKQLAVNAAKDAIAKGTLAALAKKHGEEFNQWRMEYDALQKKNGTSQADLVAANASNALWRERVRLDMQTLTQQIHALPESGQGSAGSGGDGDAAFIRRAYDTLEIACKITTIDYNTLRLSWDSACLIYGCKKP